MRHHDHGRRTATLTALAGLALACGSGSGRGDDLGDAGFGSETGIVPDPETSGAEGADETGDESGTDSGGPVEICDGFDNDGNGHVDEGCSCNAGDVQTCFAGPPEAFLECRGTTQTCEGGVGSEAIWMWGACAGLCDGSTPGLDDVAGTRVWGAAPGDGFLMVGRAPLGDPNGDGELDLIAPSAAGDGLAPDTGVGYVLWGGPCLQGATLDLATLPLDGSLDDELRGGFVVDDTTTSGAAFAVAADVDADGRQDVIVSESGTSLGVVFGSDTPSASYSTTQPDGGSVARLVGGGGSNGMYGGIAAGDLDSDGFADVFMSAHNSTVPSPSCPCAPNGISVWWGRASFPPETPRDALVDIGIGTVGIATQSNFSVLGGVGDFDNDGHLDLTTGNGAGNDGSWIPYRTSVWFGGPDRALPSNMLDVDGSTGFRLVGGLGQGAFPGHQHGDFDGDGIDDLIAFAYVPYDVGDAVYVVRGRTGAFPAELDAGALASEGTTILAASLLGPDTTMGVGDIDGDGLDDLVIPLADAENGGVLVVWGRVDPPAMLDAETDPLTLVIEGAPGLGRTSQIAVTDLDGDGLGDVIVGAPGASTPNGERSGAGFVKYGSCLAEHHHPDLVRGQDGGDAIVGTPASDRVAAGRGDDLVDGGGGLDVLSGGQGDDRLAVRDASFVRVHGGLGEDTLVLTADALVLDLRLLGRARVQEIERFELGGGAQTLALGAGDVSALSSSTRTFVVEGDAADDLVLEGGWAPGGDPDGDGLHAYVHGGMTVLVREDITVATLP